MYFNKSKPTIKETVLICFYKTPVYKFYRFLYRTFCKFRRVVQWVPFLWNDVDWDANTIYGLLEFKLKRINETLCKSEAEMEQKTMKALRIAIKLCSRLSDDIYEDMVMVHHEKKWGTPDYTMEPDKEDPRFFIMIDINPKTQNPIAKEQERKERHEKYRAAETIKNRDKKTLMNILNTYVPAWWD